MAVGNGVDSAGWLADQIGACEPDVLRSVVKALVEALMSAEADAVCRAGYRARSEGRVNRRNGYRSRGLGHPCRHRGAGDSQAAQWIVLP